MRVPPSLLAALIVVTPAAARAGQAAPVVLELFTSQGCSSCPPADELLTRLAGRDDVLALSLHVDYWDYLGWKDSFGSPAYTARQRAYAKAARSRAVFTPEMVVQGQDRLVGHDADGIEDRIAAHLDQPAPVSLSVWRDGAALVVGLEADGQPLGAADVQLVRFTPSDEVSIEAGENAGKDITYTNVVTGWETIGRWDGQSAVELRAEAAGDGPAAVIVQQAHTGPVLAAARVP